MTEEEWKEIVESNLFESKIIIDGKFASKESYSTKYITVYPSFYFNTRDKISQILTKKIGREALKAMKDKKPFIIFDVEKREIIKILYRKDILSIINEDKKEDIRITSIHSINEEVILIFYKDSTRDYDNNILYNINNHKNLKINVVKKDHIFKNYEDHLIIFKNYYLHIVNLKTFEMRNIYYDIRRLNSIDFARNEISLIISSLFYYPDGNYTIGFYCIRLNDYNLFKTECIFQKFNDNNKIFLKVFYHKNEENFQKEIILPKNKNHKPIDIAGFFMKHFLKNSLKEDFRDDMDILLSKDEIEMVCDISKDLSDKIFCCNFVAEYKHRIKEDKYILLISKKKLDYDIFEYENRHLSLVDNHLSISKIIDEEKYILYKLFFGKWSPKNTKYFSSNTRCLIKVIEIILTKSLWRQKGIFICNDIFIEIMKYYMEWNWENNIEIVSLF